MKKIISTCIALMVSAACSISAFAMEVPTNTTIQDLNGVRQYIKIYTVALDTDPQSLIDDVFEYDGYTYTYSSMTKEEQSYSEKEHHTETVTADTEKSDLSVVLKALSPSIEYDDGEFRGTLYLDHSTISTVASGYTTKSYTVSATKEIDNLDTNDMAYVPDTTTKNGVTVQLQSVDWQVQGTSLVDDILVPAQYKAVATYAGRASYRAATGYVTTAKYIGDILRSRRCVKGGSFRPMKRRQSLLPRPRENWITYFPNWAENLPLYEELTVSLHSASTQRAGSCDALTLTHSLEWIVTPRPRVI